MYKISIWVIIYSTNCFVVVTLKNIVTFTLIGWPILSHNTPKNCKNNNKNKCFLNLRFISECISLKSPKPVLVKIPAPP